MFPIYDSRGEPVGLRRPRAGRRRPEVQELARDADLPEEPAALRPQLGEGRDRRSRGGHHLRGLHRRHGVRARRRAERGRDLRHRARRRPLPDPQEPRPQGGARVRRRRRGPGRGREVVRLGAAVRDPAAGRRPPRRARPRRRLARRSRGAPRVRSSGRRRSCSSGSTACSRAADSATLEGRARAAETAAAIVAEHPSDLVRDQYVMKLAGELDIDADRLREAVAASTARARHVDGRAQAAAPPSDATHRRSRSAASTGASSTCCCGRSTSRSSSSTGSTPGCSPIPSRAVRSRRSRRPTASTTRSAASDGPVHELLERLAVEEPVGVRRAGDVARASDGQHRRTGGKCACSRGCTRRRRTRHVSEVLLDALAHRARNGRLGGGAAQRNRVARVGRRRNTQGQRPSVKRRHREQRRRNESASTGAATTTSTNSSPRPRARLRHHR